MKLYESLEEIKTLLKNKIIKAVAFQGIDFSSVENELEAADISESLFLGCKIPSRVFMRLYSRNYIFPDLNVPYKTYPKSLYTGVSLYEGYDRKIPSSYRNSYDKKVYDYYMASSHGQPIIDSLSQALHDHSISENMMSLLESYSPDKIVAIMGGHGLSRLSPMYRQIAILSSMLARRGYLMLSGGGPGAMEATHLGVWMAGYGEEGLDKALEVLSPAPSYDNPAWLDTAFEVMELFPEFRYESLGIPTWHYGHELATPFATKIAKYFSNSIREEGLLAVAKGGVIYSPGSAGTMQEIFQDLAQNHYVSYGMASPMIFLGKKYWSEEKPVYPLIQEMSSSGKLSHIILSITDDNERIIEELEKFSSLFSSK